MQHSVVVFILSILDWKKLFWANLIQKIKIVRLSWNLLMFNSSQFNGDVHFLCFQPEISCLGKFVLKIKTLSLILNLVPRLIWMQNSMVFIFSVRLEVPILGIFGPKNQICQFKLKFDTYNHVHHILRLFCWLSKFSFYHKWNKAWLLVITWYVRVATT